MRTLRVATYNVHGHKGMDRRVSTDRPLQVLRQIGADCIALQEFVNAATAGEPLLERWARALGMQAACAPAFERGGEVFATAILSRLNILETHTHDISLRGYRRRVMLEVVLDAGDVRVQAMSVHLGVSPRERARQAEQLYAICSATRADVHLLLGDFNEWHRFGVVASRLRRHFGVGRRLATFPAASPLLPLDRIYVHPRERLLDTHVVTMAAARRASDHLPLVATIALAAAPRA